MTTIDRTANDNTPEALKAAAHNWKLVRPDWCSCGNIDQIACAATNNIAYYRDPKSGTHGWMCCVCRGIWQTG